MSIGWVIFWKSVILTAWASYQEFREKHADATLLAAFQAEWDRRRAKHPLRLLPPEHFSE